MTKHIKKANKSKKGKSASMRKYRKQRNQRGGNDNACLAPSAAGQVNYNIMGSGANVHNTNPQAALDLDNLFMKYGGPVPNGSSILGGGGKCGDEGVGTDSPKSQTFKNYMNSLDAQLSVGGFRKGKKSQKSRSRQRGSGYTVDPSAGFIGGQPVNMGYDDNSPPAIVGGQMVYGAPDQPLCGIGAIKGGGKKSQRRSQRSANRNKRSRRAQRGGNTSFVGIGSKPADYDSAYNGPPGVFNYPEDMNARTYDEHQPIWSPKAI